MKMIQERLRSLAARLNLKKQKKGYEKQVPISSKLLPVYVGDQELEGNLKRYDVPVACTSSIIFQALLRQFDDILVKNRRGEEADRFPPLTLEVAALLYFSSVVFFPPLGLTKLGCKFFSIF
ncbi:hypothetical protein NC652_019571 [Populus alba x Populus x berolinensis]|nr:hypothetical protein NC652_019571 [Populus alba x Populus x berolinensis]